jgi:uncharacterized membrane protein YdjX (TVP38/TMEM64 family)
MARTELREIRSTCCSVPDVVVPGWCIHRPCGLLAAVTSWVRLGLLAVFLIGVYLVGRMSGLTEQLTVEGIRESMRQAGVGGFLVFVVTFCVGQLLYIPGFVFVMVSGLAYGPVWGSVASVIAATISVAVSFVIVRTIGGQPLKNTNTKKPFLQKSLSRLEQDPIRSMIVIRLFLWAIPPVNYTLAMSGVSFRDYMIAAVIGMTPPFVTLSVLAGLGFNLL